MVDLRGRDGDMRDPLDAKTPRGGQTPAPTMLCVNMDTFCVELSGSRRTRRPSFAGEVTVKTTDRFLLMSSMSLVMA